MGICRVNMKIVMCKRYKTIYKKYKAKRNFAGRFLSDKSRRQRMWDKRVFVTGASGFIGQYVVKKLIEEGHKPVILVRNKDHYQRFGDEIVLEGNLKKIPLLLERLGQFTFHTCIHLAWEGIPDYSYEYSKCNFEYGMAILELCRKMKIPHLIITGSCWEYEDPVGIVSEKAKISYANYFKASKTSLRMFAEIFCKDHGIQLNWLRLFYVYGAGQRQESLIPHIISSFQVGKQPELNGAYNRNDFIYVTDVADAIVQCVEKVPQAIVMNVGSGYATQVLDIVKLVAQQMHIKKLDIETYEKPKKATIFYADIQLIKNELKWLPKIDMEMGIKMALHYNSSRENFYGQ